MADVTFYAPTIGAVSVPVGLSGHGTVECLDEGLQLTGMIHNKTASSGFGCLGFLLGLGAMNAILIITRMNLDAIGGGGGVFALALGGAFGGVFLGRRLFPPRRRVIVVPWSKLRELRAEEQYITLKSGVRPKGQLWFAVGHVAGKLEGPALRAVLDAREPVMQAIRGAAEAHGVKL